MPALVRRRCGKAVTSEAGALMQETFVQALFGLDELRVE
jgi:DNA-directed RNA polymerase specialized sigma24 family protein